MPPPIVNATLQAAFLAAVSNVLAQVLQAYRAARPLTVDPVPALHFVILTLLTCPPNFLWQEFLEDTFPGYTDAAVVTKVEKRSSSEVATQKKLNVRNTATKFALDQTVSAFVNTLVFIAIINALKGADGEAIVFYMKRDWWSLMSAGFRLWPLVSLVSFTLIPVERRIIFGSTVAVGWNVFLSLFASEQRA